MTDTEYSKSRAIATGAHAGQKRKNGKVSTNGKFITYDDYITHPIQVAKIASGIFLKWAGQNKDDGTVVEDIIDIAHLHDTVEDTDVTMEDISSNFNKRVSMSVELLTHDETSLTYFQYIRRILMSDCIEAKIVKLADLTHNLVDASPKFMSKNKIELYKLAKFMLEKELDV
jgi:(p)ppGpp synthase/HD superfamily hydrolase